VIAYFAVHFIDASPGRLLAFRRLGARQGDFHVKAVQRTAQGNATLCRGRVAVKAVAASGDNRVLELQNHFIAETRGIGQVSRGAADCGDEAVVGVHVHINLVGKVSHV